ncbi:MAG: rhomboid family intramembrane serine protease [Chitinophagales bacterium]
MSLSDIEQQRVKYSLLLPTVFVVVLWVVKLIELSTGYSFASWGIEPRTLSGLRGIVFSPFLHGDLSHLFSNSFPVILLGFIILHTYRSIAFELLFWLTVMSGFWTWVIGRPSYHIGASGVIYGMAFFVFFSGILRKDTRSMALALLVTFFYGGLIWGLLPIQEGVSWEGHIAGALAGITCAFFYYLNREIEEVSPFVLEGEEDELEVVGEPFWMPKNKELPHNISDGEQKWNVKYHYIRKQSDEE